MNAGANSKNFNGNYPEQRYHFNACPLLLPGRGRIQWDRANGYLESGQHYSGQSAKSLVRADYCTVEASAVRRIDGNAAGGAWRAVGGERRPALQIRGGLNDVIHVGLSGQRELKLTT